MQQYGKAIKFLEQAEVIEKEPKIYYIYALVMFKQQNYEKGLKMINEAIKNGEGKYEDSVLEGYKSLKTKNLIR
jgi:tetratricopeptide (TPR) repeat protein